MARRIAPHITVVHDFRRSERELATAAASLPPLAVRVTGAQCWAGRPEDGIYLGVEDAGGHIAALRGALGVVDPPGVVYVPHVTLVHPRTAADSATSAWVSLREWRPDAVVTIEQVALLELIGDVWSVAATASLLG